MRRLLIKLLLKLIPKVKYATKLSLIEIPVGVKISSVSITMFSNFISFTVQGSGSFFSSPHLSLEQYEEVMSDFHIVNAMIKKEKRYENKSI